jgi:hypothetical protein
MDLGQALVSLVSGGLAGGLVGLGGAWYWQLQTRKAAGKALLAELFTNLERTLSAATTPARHDPGDTVWRSQMPLIAKLLRWPKLKTIVHAYDAGFRLRDNIQGIESSSPDAAARHPQSVEELDRSRRRYETIESWHVQTAIEWLKAIDILQAVVLTRSERCEFEEDLKRVKETLSSYKL